MDDIKALVEYVCNVGMKFNLRRVVEKLFPGSTNFFYVDDIELEIFGFPKSFSYMIERKT